MTPRTIQLDDGVFLSLLAAAREGDKSALDALFSAFYPTVERLVHFRLARDHRLSRPWLSARFSTGDVVQEVFSDILRDLHSFRGSNAQAFCGYLAMVVKNRIVDAIRHHEAAKRDGRRTANTDSNFNQADTNIDPAMRAAHAEEQTRFEALLSSFDPREQLLLRGRVEHETSFEMLADQLGYSSTSAAKRAFYLIQARLVMRMRDKNNNDH